MGASGKEILQREVDDWAEFEERRNCDIARLRAGHLLGSRPAPAPQPPAQRRTPWVRAVIRAGIPAIALVLALFPWALSVPPPPDIRAHADAPGPSPQVSASPKEQRQDAYPPQAHIPVAPTAAPVTPMPMPTPAVVHSPAATTPPTVSATVPAPATPTPSAPPVDVPGGATPGITPRVSPSPEPSSTPKHCLAVALLCPPQN